MKKTVISIAALAAALSLGIFAPKAEAAYGKIGHVVTPANLRGNWYYKGVKTLGQDQHHFYKVHIGKHHVNGIKLYQADLKKTSNYARHYKKYRYVIDNTMNWGNATIFNRNGIQWLNVNGWTAGAGNGISYGLVTKTRRGKQVEALAIATGYKPFINAYAYHHHPVHYQTYLLENN